MCGICGFYKTYTRNRFISEEVINLMNDEMRSRGPDGSGIFMQKDNLCGMGHRRLSIVDLDQKASQPMSSPDGSIVISFNGEIYNHADIRDELIDSGIHNWKTHHSDTEVIIRAYEQWGIECINRLRGMFAFALWDENAKQFFLVRDRVGIKPLYYVEEDGVLFFSSEIKSILRALKKKPDVNKKAMYDYLSFLAAPGEDTLFTGIKKLRPGSYIKYGGGVMDRLLNTGMFGIIHMLSYMMQIVLMYSM